MCGRNMKLCTTSAYIRNLHILCWKKARTTAICLGLEKITGRVSLSTTLHGIPLTWFRGFLATFHYSARSLPCICILNESLHKNMCKPNTELK